MDSCSHTFRHTHAHIKKLNKINLKVALRKPEKANKYHSSMVSASVSTPGSYLELPPQLPSPSMS